MSSLNSLLDEHDERDGLESNPLVDFLFNMVIALVVALAFFTNVQDSARFALPETVPVPGAVTPSEYRTLIRVVVDDDGQRKAAGEPFGDDAHLVAHVKRLLVRNGTDSGNGSGARRVLFSASREPPHGLVEDLKNALLAAGIDVLKEQQSQQQQTEPRP